MKVLTDWATGAPPCKGWWLSRIHKDEFGGPSLYYWDGKQWSYKNGFVASVQDREWCGLAFNPDTVIMAKLFCDDNVVRVLPVIQEFTR